MNFFRIHINKPQDMLTKPFPNLNISKLQHIKLQIVEKLQITSIPLIVKSIET